MGLGMIEWNSCPGPRKRYKHDEEIRIVIARDWMEFSNAIWVIRNAHERLDVDIPSYGHTNRAVIGGQVVAEIAWIEKGIKLSNQMFLWQVVLQAKIIKQRVLIGW
jgi:hypothetical protein